ncbi:hypothetical protein CAP36_06890 [Chitinophagaceae bacterium IBVUCB2]|nr:hypothetical protein CAP36_06890 [Chitinophagaceae bacterium IBVUCB2]
MEKQSVKQKIFSSLRWIGWVILVQFILLNISAAMYAHRFTHFYNDPSVEETDDNPNVFKKTWRLFAGQRYAKSVVVNEPDFPVDTVHLTTKKELLIDCWYSKIDSAAKGTVILYHPLSTSKSKVAAEAEEFRNWGYNVFMIDFRAHGNSEGNNTTIGYREAEEVKLAYDYIAAKGEKNIFLWGASMGAVAIIKAVADYKLQPRGIIAEMPFETLRTHISGRARNIGFRGFPEKPFGVLVTAWIGIERGFNGFKLKTTTYAKKVTSPVLLQWGALDRLVEKSETDNIFEALASPQKKLVVYNNIDHENFLQRDPLKWRIEVERFLSGIR